MDHVYIQLLTKALKARIISGTVRASSARNRPY